MTPIELNEPLLDQFDLFSKNKLSKEEAATFKLRLDQEPDLRSLYDAFLISNATIESKIESDLRQQLQEWKEISGSSPTKTVELPNRRQAYRITWYKVAAAASILFAVGICYFNVQKLNREQTDMVENLLEIPDNATRGNNMDSMDLNAIASKHKNDPAQAVALLKKIQVADIQQGQRQAYMGKFYIRMGDYPQAMESFKQAKVYGSQDGDIGLLLTYFKSGNSSVEFKQLLEEVLANPNHINHGDAVKINKIINGIWWKLSK